MLPRDQKLTTSIYVQRLAYYAHSQYFFTGSISAISPTRGFRILIADDFRFHDSRPAPYDA